MKIAFICNEYPTRLRAGGIGTFVQTAARGLADRGHKVCVVGYGVGHGETKDHGVHVIVLPQCTIGKLAWHINRRRIYSWLKQRARAGDIDCHRRHAGHWVVSPSHLADNPCPSALAGAASSDF